MSEAGEAKNLAMHRLRAEFTHSTHDERRARLWHEIGEVAERASDDPSAVAAYLDAADLFPSAIESLEGAVRVLERARDRTRLLETLEKLVRSSRSPRQRVRALLSLAAYHAFDRDDFQAAREALLEAGDTDCTEADRAAVQLLTEVVAGRLGDDAMRAAALAARAALPGSSEWKNLLLVDALALAPALDEEQLAEKLAESEGPMLLATAATLLRRFPPVQGKSPTARRALAAEASVVSKAIEVPALRASLGLPEWKAKIEQLVDLRFRESLYCEDHGDAMRLLAETADCLRVQPSNVQLRMPVAERLVVHELIRRAELAGDTEVMMSWAESRRDRERDPVLLSNLRLKLAEGHAANGQGAEALAELSRATELDPRNLPALALEIDLLSRGTDYTRLTTRLEKIAAIMPTSAARARLFVLGAFVQVAREKNTTAGKRLLALAKDEGLTLRISHRVSRLLAAFARDAVWYFEAVAALRETTSDDVEKAWLTLEKLRHDVLEGAPATARHLLDELAAAEPTRWLARALAVTLPQFRPDAEAFRALAETEPTVQRAMLLAAVARAHADGNADEARRSARELIALDPSDPLALTLATELSRGVPAEGGSPRTQLFEEAAKTTLDESYAASLLIAGGFDAWRSGDRAQAENLFSRAAARARGSTAIVSAWTRRLVTEGSSTEPEGWPEALTSLDEAAVAALSLDANVTRKKTRELMEGRDRALREAGALLELATHETRDARVYAWDALERESPRLVERARAADEFRVMRAQDSREAVGLAEKWLYEAEGGLAANLEWLAQAVLHGDAGAEGRARRELPKHFSGEAADTLTTAAAGADAIAASLAWGAGAEGEEVARSDASRLMHLAGTKPGTPERRGALANLGGALGARASVEAEQLSGFHLLFAGQPEEAKAAFRRALEAQPADLHAWEGLRLAAEATQDQSAVAEACEVLANRTHHARNAALMFEHAALAYLKANESEAAERALFACLARDPTRRRAFDFLFRRLRRRKDHKRVLPLLETQIPLTDDPSDLAKLYWEKARSLRDLGQIDDALEALAHVTTLDPDHVGALALTGEAFLKMGKFDTAATTLGRLARLPDAPPKNRVTAGVAAAEIFETKLDDTAAALSVLSLLRADKLAPLPVIERIAKLSGKLGKWEVAADTFRELREARSTREGRVEAARLELAIARDRLHDPRRGLVAATYLLKDDGAALDALDFLLDAGLEDPSITELLTRSRDKLLDEVRDSGVTEEVAERLLRIARAIDDVTLELSAGATHLILAGPSALVRRVRRMDQQEPTSVLSETALAKLLAPGDSGALSRLFAALSEALGEAYGPSLSSLGVSKRDRIDPRAGLSVRHEVASWVGAFGLNTFELYIGGRSATGITCVADATPKVVVGPAVRAPFDPETRANIAASLLALRRGIAIVEMKDDATLEAIVEVVCHLAKVGPKPRETPLYAEVERLLSKAVNKRLRGVVEASCRQIIEERPAVRAWATAARTTLARVRVVASGDPTIVAADWLGETQERLHLAAQADVRVRALLQFCLSREFFEVRRSLGLGEPHGRR